MPIFCESYEKYNIGNNENSGRQTIARTKLHHRLRPARSRGQLPIIHFSPRRRAQSFLQRANASETVHDSRGTSDSEMHEENEGRAHTRRCFVTRFAVRPSGRNDYM